jgi:hypothetical protein
VLRSDEAQEGRGMVATDDDAELKAINAMLTALEPLDREARDRALDYVFKRLGIAPSVPVVRPVAETQRVDPSPIETVPEEAPKTIVDIRTLREEKQPKTAMEMAAVVAYYLAELAPPDQRKDAIATADIEKYFKQAGHRLPTAPQYTLSNAAAAGYFDSAGRGLYRLNPVGYNLVAHSLPGRPGGGQNDSSRQRRPPVKKSRSTKKTSGSSAKKTASKRAASSSKARVTKRATKQSGRRSAST